MTVTKDDFEKVWASQSPLTPYEFSESKYKEGWNFIGGTPPSRQMWDFLQKQNDEKSKYLFDNFDNYLPLSGGTLTGDVLGVTPPNGDNSKKLANTEFIQALANILVPTGCVQAFAGQTTPTGWLLCDGSAVSRTTYAKLFSVIGTSYGNGDGSTTFNLPNLVDKFIQGNATAGTVKSAGLPNITGKVRGTDGTGEGAFTPAGNPGLPRASGSSNVALAYSFDASLSNPIYGASTTVQPPALTCRYIIKYE
jgi:microcystin-dependent protein